MTVTFLLVHPPLLGPAVWGPSAQRLAAAGHRVAVPDLRGALDPPARWWDRAAAAAMAGVTGPVVVAGHSGAGVLLPLVADRLDRVEAVVFVDALVPAATGSTAPSGRFRSLLDELEVSGGLLPPWSSWWGPGALAELVPDAELRARIEAEQPRLSQAFYDEPVPVPGSWPPPRVAYLQLSPAYDADAVEASRRGWPVRSLAGRHLDLAVRPDEVVAEILALSAAAEA